MTFMLVPKFCSSRRCLDDVKTDVHRDDTEATDAGDFDENFDPIDNELLKGSSSVTTEESLESSFIELQHELREKTSQCTILRETLTTMSATMRRLEFQLQDKMAELEKKITMFDQKAVECESWKEKYEELQSKMDSEKAIEIELNATSTMIDCSLLEQYKYESYTNRRPWRNNKDGDKENCDELSIGSDSIDEQHGSDLIDKFEYRPRKPARRKTKSKRKGKKQANSIEDHSFSEKSKNAEIRPVEGCSSKPSPSKTECHSQPDRTLSEIDGIPPDSTITERHCFSAEPKLSDCEVDCVSLEPIPVEVDQIADCNPPNPMPLNIESLPPEMKAFVENDREVSENEFDNSWGNIECCFSEEESCHDSNINDNCDMDQSKNYPFQNYPFQKNISDNPSYLLHDERRVRRLRRRVIRSAKRAALKAQFQCEMVEF